MKSILWRVLTGFALLLLSAGVGRGLQAQACAFCNYNGGPDSHYFTADTCTEGGGCRKRSDAPVGHIGCHAPGYTGECSNGHSTCAQSFGGDEEALLVSLKTFDSSAIIRLLQFRAGVVFLNEERRALQIRDCNGAIAVHIPIRSESMLVALQLGLATAQMTTLHAYARVVTLGKRLSGFKSDAVSVRGPPDFAHRNI